jgi:hypothetical protein
MLSNNEEALSMVWKTEVVRREQPLSSCSVSYVGSSVYFVAKPIQHVSDCLPSPSASVTLEVADVF